GLPGVTLLITNISTNIAYRTVTNDQGLYRVPSLQPGIYRMTLDKDGFKSVVKSGIELHIQDVASINFELQIGSINETVTVAAGEPPIDAADAVTGQTINRTFINDLPLLSRSALDLAFLTPGVNQPPSFVYGQSASTVPYLTSNNFVSNGSRNATR